MAINATVSGLPDLREALAGITPKLRKQALRNALAAGARVVRDEAKRFTPVLSAPVRNRNPGTVRDAIKVRTSKTAQRGGDVGVFVNVKPLKANVRGKNNPNDPFYWRWINFGWNPASKGAGGFGTRGRRIRRKLNKANANKLRQGFHFLERGASALPKALEVFKTVIAAKLEKLNGGRSVEL